MSGKRPLLEARDLRTHFFTRRGVVKAVDGVSFQVAEGETLGLVGESGCGKSITCLSLLRLVPQPGRIVGGSVLLEGENLVAKSEAEMRRIRGRRIAMILQDPMTSLNPAYTIGDQVGEAVRCHNQVRGGAVRDRVIEALTLVRVAEAERRIDDYPHQMSGGMRQRVAGAIAFSCQPRLLIADEPTTALDVTTQAQYLRLLKEIQQQSLVAILFVTHDFGCVAKMCDRVVVMYAGKIVESAPVRELFNRPWHPYTKALMACLPKLHGREKLYSIEGQPPDLSALPPGCSFAPRCAGRKPACEESYPTGREVSPGHWASCCGEV